MIHSTARLTFLVPGDLQTRTGGYGYDRRILAGLGARGWSVDITALDASFPSPTLAARSQAARALAEIPDESIVMIDGLALGALPEEAARERSRLRLVALVHHPLAEETGLDTQSAAELETSERQALANVRLVVVTSQATAASLARYEVEPARIRVVEPGTDPAPLASGSGDTAVHLICVASFTPRKGHMLLAEALAAVADRQWRLTCAGSVDRDPDLVDRFTTRLREAGLQDRVALVGDLNESQLDAHYDRADLFVLPTLFEGYGMAVAEAIARGLPVVSTQTGAIPALAAGAGVVVPCGDANALAGALAAVLDDETIRDRLAAGARRARLALPTWDQAVERMEAALRSVPSHA